MKTNYEIYYGVYVVTVETGGKTTFCSQADVASILGRGGVCKGLAPAIRKCVILDFTVILYIKLEEAMLQQQHQAKRKISVPLRRFFVCGRKLRCWKEVAVIGSTLEYMRKEE